MLMFTLSKLYNLELVTNISSKLTKGKLNFQVIPRQLFLGPVISTSRTRQALNIYTIEIHHVYKKSTTLTHLSPGPVKHAEFIL